MTRPRFSGWSLVILGLGAVLMTGGCRRDPNEMAGSAVGSTETAVVVQDDAGVPVAGARVFVAPGEDSGFPATPLVTAADGVARVSEFWRAGRPRDPVASDYNVVVVHTGHRSVVLRRFSGHATLRLRASKSCRVRVRLGDATVLPTPPSRITPILEWMDADPNWQDPRALEPLNQEDWVRERVIEFDVDDPGQYLFGVSLRGPTGAIRERLNVSDEWESFVDVSPSPLEIDVFAGDEIRVVDASFDASGR